MRRRPKASGGQAAARLVAPAIAAGLIVVQPSEIGQQDVAGMLLRQIDTSSRWAVTLAPGPGGVTELVTSPAAEKTGAAAFTVGDGSIVIEGADPVITGAVEASAAIPDEDRIDRSWKGDLPATFTTPATAPGFSAGSIFPEHSRFVPADQAKLPKFAFESTTAPLSILAVGRFIAPAMPMTDVAILDPVPKPERRPDVTLLVDAAYPARTFTPSDANGAAETVLAAYAPDNSVVDQDVFDALFAMPKERPDVPVAVVNPGDHWWAARPLPATIYLDTEPRCLAEAVYFEARGERRDGQVAVAQVVMNRVRNPAYPDTICGVVYQNKSKRNACQFSFACDGIRDVVREGPAWTRAKAVAHDVTYGGAWLDEVGTATHYHATYVRPRWAGIFKKKAKIGLHVFYQTIYGGWS